jgi:hypothetical protein
MASRLTESVKTLPHIEEWPTEVSTCVWGHPVRPASRRSANCQEQPRRWTASSTSHSPGGSTRAERASDTRTATCREMCEESRHDEAATDGGANTESEGLEWEGEKSQVCSHHGTADWERIILTHHNPFWPFDV